MLSLRSARLAQGQAKRTAAEVGALNDRAGHADMRALAGDAVTLAYHPDGAGAVIELITAGAQQPERRNNVPRNCDFLVVVAAGIAVDIGDGGALWAAHQQR